jgi:protein TIF31
VRELEVKINVNLETGISFTRNAETDKQEQQLKDMAKFLRQVCIPKLINSLAFTDKRLLSDSRGIAQAFHKHGVNMRYLGEVCSHKLTVDHPQIKVALERIILVRSAKHLFRIAMRETSPMQMSIVLARLLNCLFASKSQLINIEEGKVPESKKDTLTE